MKKGILFTTMFFLFFLGMSPVFSGQQEQEPKDQASWKTYNPEGDHVGTIKKDKKRFIFYDKDEITLKEKSKPKGIRKGKKKSVKEWEMYNREDEFVGVLKEEKRFYNLKSVTGYVTTKVDSAQDLMLRMIRADIWSAMSMLLVTYFMDLKDI